MARLNEDRATRYHRSRLRAAMAARTAVLLVLATAALGGARLSAAVERVTAGSPAPWVTSTLLLTALIALAAGAARLPFDVFADWTLARRYGLERLPLARWGARHAREALVSGLLACAAAVAVRAAFLLPPERAWVVAALSLWGGQLGWGLLMPLVLARSGALQPLAAADLQGRLTGLGSRLGVRLDVRQWHGGGARQAHAILVGLGRHRRVIVSTTLVETLSPEELEVVVAHELAHHVHGDVWMAAAWRLVVWLAALAAAWLLLPFVGPRGAPAAALSALPALGLIVHVVIGLAAPAGFAISRRHERRADAFALAETRNPEAFVSSMRRLAAHNLIDERPTRLTRLLSSHPPVRDRVRAALAQPVMSAAGPHEPRRASTPP